MKKILVTGGLGFIGSYFVKLLLDRGYFVINIDKMTYAIRKDLDFEKNKNYQFIKADIADITDLPPDIDQIVNFAAESHVDNSIKDSMAFFRSNVEGVYNMLELIRKTDKDKRPVFVHISTDEVYGDILEGAFRETDKLSPSNPYSSTKAAADQLVSGWSRTYGIRARICRSSNNYGYGQYAEKLIPKTMKLATKGLKVGVQGNGMYKREWTWVEDNCNAILLVMEKGEDGEIYNISAGEELTNIEVVKKILKVMGQSEDFFEFIKDRPGQDIRYSIDTEKIKKLGWAPNMTLEKYLPICKELNEIRRKNLPPGIKDKIRTYLGLRKNSLKSN